MRKFLLILISALLLFSGCAVDTLQEEELIFDLTDDIWEGFEYLIHTQPERPFDIEFPLADDRSLFLC